MIIHNKIFLGKMRKKIKILGKNKRKNNTHNSTIKSTRIIKSDRLIRNDLIIIPKIIENTTKPSLYSFFNGLKKVLSKRERERSDVMYWLKATKKRNTPPKTSLYQNTTR